MEGQWLALLIFSISFFLLTLLVGILKLLLIVYVHVKDRYTHVPSSRLGCALLSVVWTKTAHPDARKAFMARSEIKVFRHRAGFPACGVWLRKKICLPMK